MCGGEAPALVVGLGHVTCDEHGSKAPVVMVHEKGGSHLELATTGGALYHEPPPRRPVRPSDANPETHEDAGRDAHPGQDR
jgi:hypothetical protein